MGQDGSEKAKTQKLPDSEVRVHQGQWNALLSSVRQVGCKRYAIFLGSHWKGTLWRAQILIISSNLDNLVFHVGRKLELLKEYSIVGMAIVNYSSELDTELDDALIGKLHQFSDRVCKNLAVLMGSITSTQIKGQMRVFQFEYATCSKSPVWMHFLAKRLEKESVYVFDVDKPLPASLASMVNKAVSEAWGCIYIALYFTVCIKVHTCLQDTYQCGNIMYIHTTALICINTGIHKYPGHPTLFLPSKVNYRK